MKNENTQTIIEQLEKENAELRLKLEAALSHGITVREQTEKLLHRREQAFRALAENTPDTIARYDIQCRRRYANPAFAALAGVPAEKLLGKTPTDYSATMAALEYEFKISGVFQKRKADEYEYTWPDRDGKAITSHVRIVPEFDQNGRVVSVLCVGRDITGRKRMEEALAAREREFRTLAENSPDNIIRYDTACRCVYVNPQLEKTLQAPLADLAGKTPVEHAPAGKYRELQLKAEEVLRTGADAEIDLVEPDTGTGIRYFNLRLIAERDHNGAITGVLAVGRDITALKSAEWNLMLLNHALNRVHEAAYLICEDGRFVYVNEEACRFLEYSREELLSGMVVADIDPEMAQNGWQDHWRDFKDKGGHTIERRHTTRQGDIVSVEINATYFEYNGIGYSMALARDITERRRMEEELHKKNAELERFTYTVSHDLKSPLITINSFCGSIKTDLASGRFDRLEKDLERIEAAAGKMTVLLDDLLKLSRAGHVINASAPVDMAKLVDSVLNNLAGTLKETGVQVTVQPGLPTVSCDRQRMMEVLQNLIENAIKYRGYQPEPRIEIGLREEEHRRVFFVQDNGPGIDPKFHENIFGLFNRLNTHVPGTGIGLALAKRIIEVHGGSIWVESDGNGNGSTFCFTVG